MALHDRQKGRWLIEFGIVSLVPIIVLGLVVAQSLRSSIRDRALNDAKQQAVVVTKLAIEPQFSAADYANGVDSAKAQRIDSSLTDGPLAKRLVFANVRNLAGRIIYSTDRRLIGRTVAQTDSVREAMSGGVGSNVQPDGEGGKVVATLSPVHGPG
ncbi:MAG: hypothetical protein QOJ07_3731, partial [Thermoleophilaceae bacterium]|nr:hypothetical protein [Thermoleophilaceae bacterium]